MHRPSSDRTGAVWRDVRGTAVSEKVVIVAIILTVGAIGVFTFAKRSETALNCQGGAIVAMVGGNPTCVPRLDGAAGKLPTTVSEPSRRPACSGASCMCFVAGTLVRTADGLIPIEQVQVGALVLARDDSGTAVDWKPVTQRFVSHSRRLVRLLVQGDKGAPETLEATANHPFFSQQRGWITASQLTAGADQLVDSSGNAVSIVSIAPRLEMENVPVFNLEVADFHTYFVGRTESWVHNRRLVQGQTHPSMQPAPRPLLFRRPFRRFPRVTRVGQSVPIVIRDGDIIVFRGRAEVIDINADGTLRVKGLMNGVPFEGVSDAQGRVDRNSIPMVINPTTGTRAQVFGPAGEAVEALVLWARAIPMPGKEIEANIDGVRRSGFLPAGSNRARWYPQPEKLPYIAGQPIMDIVPRQGRVWFGRPVTTLGNNIIIEHPLSSPFDSQEIRAQKGAFVQTTLTDLQTIASTPSGQALLTSLLGPAAASAGPTIIRFTNVYRRPPQAARIGRRNSGWNMDAGEAGGGAAVEVRVAGYDGIPLAQGSAPNAIAGDARSTRLARFGRAFQFPSDVTLFHELVHADDMRKGLIIGNHVELGGDIDVSEERAVGLGDFASAPYSENSYRGDRGLPARPYYQFAGELYSTKATRRFSVTGYLEGKAALLPATADPEGPSPAVVTPVNPEGDPSAGADLLELCG